MTERLVECLQKLGVARTRLQGEIDKAYTHIEELENMLRQVSQTCCFPKLQTYSCMSNRTQLSSKAPARSSQISAAKL